MNLSFTDTWNAIVLGIVEGITEFLPVSSTGHLIVVADFLQRNDAATETFIVVIQFGAILAVCWLFRDRLLNMLQTIKIRKTQNFISCIAIAFIPAAVVGLLFHKQIKAYLFSPLFVAIALIVGGIIIIIIEKINLEDKVTELEHMSFKNAWFIGFAQILSLFPGVSRAAATIMGGRLAGLSRITATEFSFFLAIPIMFAAFCLDIYSSWGDLEIGDAGFISIGFIAAFISALITVKWLLKYVATHNFIIFGWYRIIFGLLVVYLSLN